MLSINKGYCVVKKLVWNVRINAFGIQRFSAPPFVCSAPGAEIKTGGAENIFAPFGRDSAPPDFFSAPAKINPAHATAFNAYVNKSICPIAPIYISMLN